MLSGDIALVQLVKINPVVAAESAQLDSIKSRLASSKAQVLYSELLDSLKANAEIEIFK
jgi:hypothetical protein